MLEFEFSRRRQRKPIVLVEVEPQAASCGQHQTDGEGISVCPIEFGHIPGRAVTKVHPVKACNEGHGDEGGGDDRQELNDFI